MVQDEQPTLVRPGATKFGGFDAFNPNAGVVYLYVYGGAVEDFAAPVAIYGLLNGVRTYLEYEDEVLLGANFYVACSTSASSLVAPTIGVPLTVLYQAG